jgi:PhnB protein
MTDMSENTPQARSDKIIPEIFVHDGPGALAFYCRAFGAVERSRMMTRDGSKLVHGELEIAGHRLFVCDEFSAAEGGTCRCPRTLGGTGVRITLMVDDADAVVARAVAAGATVTMPVQELFWGARYGKLLDPYGHEWGINQQLRVFTPEEEAEQGRRYLAKK